MATKRAAARGTGGRSKGSPERRGPARTSDAARTGSGARRRIGGIPLPVVAGSGLVVALAAVLVGWVVLTGGPGASAGTPANAGAASTASSPIAGTVVQARGGQWTNISADTLAGMLGHKDFTLLDVKTPYIGEIAGTDLYIPYTQLAARAGELPAARGARIVVYCRSGNESAIAAQTLLDLGYTNILNLDGGMNAWVASGRQIVQLARG